jgi:formiminotetrahydrofolate cyclodeaminase
VASPRPDEPLAGAALSIAAAAAADVLAEVARVSSLPGASAQAEKLRDRVADVAAKNAEAYARAIVSREVSAALSPERRDWQIGQAYAEAAQHPLDLARTAVDLCELAAAVAEYAEPDVRADAVVAAALAAAIVRGAGALVEVNLTAGPGDERVEEVRALIATADRAAAKVS